MTNEGIVMFIGLFLFFTFAISWFVFSRISVKRIDKEMAADGVSKACPVDIMGLRIIRIAGAISMPYNSILNPEVDFFYGYSAHSALCQEARSDTGFYGLYLRVFMHITDYFRYFSGLFKELNVRVDVWA